MIGGVHIDFSVPHRKPDAGERLAEVSRVAGRVRVQHCIGDIVQFTGAVVKHDLCVRQGLREPRQQLVADGLGAGEKRADLRERFFFRRQEPQFRGDEIQDVRLARPHQRRPRTDAQLRAGDCRAARENHGEERVQVAREGKRAVQEYPRVFIDAEDFVLHGEKSRPAPIGAVHDLRRARGAGGQHAEAVVFVDEALRRVLRLVACAAFRHAPKALQAALPENRRLFLRREPMMQKNRARAFFLRGEKRRRLPREAVGENQHGVAGFRREFFRQSVHTAQKIAVGKRGLVLGNAGMGGTEPRCFGEQFIKVFHGCITVSNTIASPMPPAPAMERSPSPPPAFLSAASRWTSRIAPLAP